jgi:Secretion system C-terminal sorting domain/Beta-propeller repeat
MFKSFIAYVTVSLLIPAEFILIAQTGTQMDLILQPHQIDSRFKVFSDSVHVAWIRHYISGYTPAFDFASDIAVDVSGNIYVTGGSYGTNQSSDIVTIKYGSSGDTLWVRRYNGQSDNWDVGRALTVDVEGNVYVTGETYSDSTYFDYVTIKYNTAGIQQWVVHYDSPSNNDDGAVALTVDEFGNVYVTGHSSVFATSWDYATIKYNASGQQQWVARYNGIGSTSDFATGIAIDASGNVYVTGSSDEMTFNVYPAYATVKYNSTGVEQWVSRYSELWSYATAIAVDNSGNTYVTGRSYALGTYYDYATIKYNTMGVQEWVSRYNGPGTSDDYAYSLAIDASGNVYVTGEAFFEVGAGSDYTTIKYNNSGAEQWVARYNGSGNSVDVGNAIALDAGGNVYVTGESRGSGGDDDFATIKYNQSGIEQWFVRFNGPDNSFDLASDLAVDVSNNVYVTGRSADVGWSVYTTIKYEQDFVSAQEKNEGEMREFALEQNYPNPFNPTTKIKYSIPISEFVTLKIYDVLGNEVETLVNEEKPSGSYEVEFVADGLTSGIYFYKLQTGSFVETKKMIILK